MVSAAVVFCGGLAGLCVLSWIYAKLTAPGFRVADKHVFITGGSSGLGLALAKQYARAGAKVSIVARNATMLASAKREIESWASSDATMHPVFARPCDVTDLASVEAAVVEANAFHRCVTDHVVCNAGFFEPGLLLDQDPNIYRKTMDINFFGSYHTVKAALPHMIKTPLKHDEPRRRIIFVASAGALATVIGYAPYASSKYAIRGLSDTMRHELQLYGIETSIFYPGKISTPMVERELPGKPAAADRLDNHSIAVSADTAASGLVKGIASGYYAITLDPVTEMIRITNNGIPQRNNLLLEVLVLPLVALMQVPQRWYCDWVIRDELKKAAKQQ